MNSTRLAYYDLFLLIKHYLSYQPNTIYPTSRTDLLSLKEQDLYPQSLPLWRINKFVTIYYLNQKNSVHDRSEAK